MARLKHNTSSLISRLAEHKKRLETELLQLDPGSARDNLLEKLRQLGVAADVSRWLSSPGLRSPN
jgi:hypothetical protein